MAKSEIQVTIPLPAVEGKPGIRTDDVYDDSVDVCVQHMIDGEAFGTLILVPGGPSQYLLFGFDPAGLRTLSDFLRGASDWLEEKRKVTMPR